jgi:hypothetical protein
MAVVRSSPDRRAYRRARHRRPSAPLLRETTDVLPAARPSAAHDGSATVFEAIP